MINQIKQALENKIGKEVKFIINESRSRSIEYSGIIKKLYPNIFVLQIDGRDTSFSYSDVLTKKIIFK